MQLAGGLRFGRIGSEEISVLLSEEVDVGERLRGQMAEGVHEAVHDGIGILVLLGRVQH